MHARTQTNEEEWKRWLQITSRTHRAATISSEYRSSQLKFSFNDIIAKNPRLFSWRIAPARNPHREIKQKSTVNTPIVYAMLIILQLATRDTPTWKKHKALRRNERTLMTESARDGETIVVRSRLDSRESRKSCDGGNASVQLMRKCPAAETEREVPDVGREWLWEILNGNTATPASATRDKERERVRKKRSIISRRKIHACVVYKMLSRRRASVALDSPTIERHRWGSQNKRTPCVWRRNRFYRNKWKHHEIVGVFGAGGGATVN